MSCLHSLPRVNWPVLAYERMCTTDRALLYSIFGEMALLQSDFRRKWNFVYYNHELDRTPIHSAATYFAILEESLVRLNILPRIGYGLHGVNTSLLMATTERVDDISISLSGDDGLAMVRFFHLEGERVDIAARGVEHVMNTLKDLVRRVDNFTSAVRADVAGMNAFVRLTRTRTEVIGARPRRLLISNSVVDKLFVGCVHQVTHLRVSLDFEGPPESRCMSLQFNPAWGDTAFSWERQGLENVQWWGPRGDQLAEEDGTVATHFNTFVWNIMGADNPALEGNLKFIKEKASPRMMIFCSTLVPASMINRVQTILQFGGGWESPVHGGLWAIWDCGAIDVHFGRTNATTLNIVMRRRMF